MRTVPKTFCIGIITILCIHLGLSYAYIAENDVKYKTTDVLQEKIDYMSKQNKKLMIEIRSLNG